DENRPEQPLLNNIGITPTSAYSCLCRCRHNHDLRHTFGTRAVEKADSILELKEWMGHSSVQTTMRYLHYKSKADAARRLSEAFAADEPPTQPLRREATHDASARRRARTRPRGDLD
ncbi:MAG: tyrosine-type recombinase/integrase, partial [Solirubrobacteraceae bacterium]